MVAQGRASERVRSRRSLAMTSSAAWRTQFELRVYPERDIVMVVRSNYDTIAAYELAGAIDDLVRGGGAAR